ncbi:MAG: phosphatase PAP2 family protein [Thermoleophilaceae bacterium]|nr:phosphatase PAP2 family protein [Thermoleophilaceae bacterium]
MDYNLFKAINSLTGNGPIDSLFTFLAVYLPAILVALVAATFLVPWRAKRAERRNGAVLSTVSAGLALAVAQPIAHAINRARPFLTHPSHSHVLITRSPDPSFPSDHAAGAFALAMGIWLYDRRIGNILIGLAATLAFARVFVGTHYPTDVIGGAAMGAGIAVLLFRVKPTRKLLELVAAKGGWLWDRALTALHLSPTT